MTNSKIDTSPTDSTLSVGQRDQHKSSPFIEKLNNELTLKMGHLTAKESTFPIEGLPKTIHDFAMEIAEVYGVPIEFPAMAAISAVSAAIRKKFVLDSGKYLNFGQLWIMFVAPSGVGKSEPVSAAFQPLQELDQLSYINYQKELSEWRRNCLTAKEKRTEEPEKPYFKQCLIDDFTPESLYQTLSRNNGAISLYRDELSGWFADFGRYSKSGEISRYLSIYNNSQFCINRKSEEPLQIPDPFMSICGTIQPEILNQALNGNDLIDSGFASRFLYVYPKDLKKQRYSEKLADSEIRDRYARLIRHCYALENREQHIPLSLEAKALFIQFANVNTDQVNHCSNTFLRASYAKMEIQLLRLALIVEIITAYSEKESCKEVAISSQSMKYAIQLCDYFNANVQHLNQSREKSGTITSAEAIKIINHEMGIKNKKAFAEAIGVTRQYISKLCNQ